MNQVDRPIFQHNGEIPLGNIQIVDTFWSKYQALVRDTVIPYQWKALNDEIPDAAPSYAIHNFKIAAGLKTGEFGGLVFQDSDLAKWLEAVGYALATNPNDELKRIADETIDIIVKAQQPDGYLNTYYTIKEPDKRWTNLYECHELYCAGHMMEAAVAYFLGTGERKLLDAMCRFADCIDATFGASPDKLRGYPGHQEIELALVKLYAVTGNIRYLNLSKYFIDERGQTPNYFLDEWEKRGRTSHWNAGNHTPPNLPYNQSQQPVREQDVAVGHAVRAVYMYTGIAELARTTGDGSLLETCRQLWENVATRQMYVTGGIGSTHHGEAFSFDYDLPNDTVYAETCASIGLIFFAHAMLKNEPHRQYADVLERALYNVVIGSMSLDGSHYFYVNPLEVWPEASEKNPGKHHVKTERQKWFRCACCPPNVARLLSSLGQYIYTVDADTVYTHLYIGNNATLEILGQQVQLSQISSLPQSGTVRMTLTLDSPTEFGLALRIPAWSTGVPTVTVNGELIEESLSQNGYLTIRREWSSGDSVELNLAMEVQLVEAHPQVRADAGKLAIVRGPIVYCLEQKDQRNPLSSILLSPDVKFETSIDDQLLPGTVNLSAMGWTDDSGRSTDNLYQPAARTVQPTRVRAIPYHLWGNRGLGEMTVWIRARY